MNKSLIFNFSSATWAKSTAELIIAAIERIHQLRGSCSIMLTGGRSAADLYNAWAALPEFHKMRNVCFFFGDERCVAPKNSESNYGLVMGTLFKNGIPPTCEVIRMTAEKGGYRRFSIRGAITR